MITINTILGYFLLGISLSAPIGPINAAQINKGIQGGFWHAYAIGLGAIVADIIYMLLVYLGVIHLLDSPFIKTFLWLFGFFVLVYTGIESIKDAGKISTDSDNRSSKLSLGKTFTSGFLISLLNPLSILFWLGIYGSILAKAAQQFSFEQLLLYSGAIVFGILLWDLTMAAVSSFFRKFLTVHVLKTISIFSGISLVGFGIYFGIQAFKLLIERLP